MLDWIFEGAANWVASIMTQIMDAISGLFLEALGTDMTAMEEYFPFAVSAYTVVQYMAWALLFLVVAWQLFRAFGGPLTEAENPLHLLARGGIFAILITYAKPIFSLLLNIARAPYTALMDTSMVPSNFTFAGIQQVLSNGLTTIVSVATVVGLILLIILMIALAWNYFKLLLETVERYVLVGVLCYTSPLAYAMGASKATSRVFQSWCRMVGSQLLLVLNVWFLRAFDSSVGQFIANGGALTSGQGSIFLWLFCALALLKIAQKCDSYLAALGLSVAQTGSSMGIEMMMAARVLTGFSKGGGSAASMFGGAGKTGAAAGGAASTAAGGATGGILSGFASRYKPNSFVRDAVVDGGSRMGAGGSVGFVGRTFGGMAARNGATLTAESVSSVASRPPKVSGTIAGDIADRSLPNYMPQMASGAAGNMEYTDTQITGGHISTKAVGPDGKQANVELFSAAQYDRPDSPHKQIQAADGSQWYQVASGEGRDAFYAAPNFTGDSSEAPQVSEAFPSAPQDTVLRTVDEGTMEASYPDGSNALWYSSAFYQEPDAPHEVIQGSDGLSWYAMTPHAAPPQFDSGTGPAPQFDAGAGAAPQPGVGPGAASSLDGGEGVPPPSGAGVNTSAPLGVGADPAPQPEAGGGAGTLGHAPSSTGTHGSSADVPAGPGSAAAYNQALFGQFMPGFAQEVTTVDSSRACDGVLEVRHADGSGTAFYDRTRYQPPRGDYHVYEDSGGGQWYAIPGVAAVERKPVYQDGKPVYDGDILRTVNVESVRYASTPTQFAPTPKRRPVSDHKPPKRKT